MSEPSEPSAPVALVGAGPGDPDLLTLGAARRLAAADVVVHDRLVGPAILALASPQARLVDVGKGPGTGWSQEAINDVLVLYGLAGYRVVRLKGGDPFVFGRGGEEVAALEAAGLEWEVVPGVSSAVAGPALAGIPVTHRGTAAAFTVITATRAAGEPEPEWRVLARAGGTIVVLMGVAKRAGIAAELIAGGLDPATPVAAIADASLPSQSVLLGELADLAEMDVRNPAVLVIGEVVRLSPFARQPFCHEQVAAGALAD